MFGTTLAFCFILGLSPAYSQDIGSGPNGYRVVNRNISYNGRDYNFHSWEEIRFALRRPLPEVGAMPGKGLPVQYIVTGDWIHSEYRVWRFGESGWSNWHELSNPVPVPYGYTSHTLEQGIKSLPVYQLDNSSGLLIRNTNANNQMNI